jgi:hypothetical protein
MTATFQNSAMVLSIGIFFSLIVTGLATNLPAAMTQGLTAHGVSGPDAARIAQLPPIAVLFAAFLGYNPIETLLGPVLGQLAPDQAAFLTGRSFFPNLISQPFADGLKIAFWFAIVTTVVAAVASWLCRAPRPAEATTPRVSRSGAATVDFVLSGSGVLTGTVRSEVDGVPLVGATVTVLDPEGQVVATATTDAAGDYALRGLARGEYTLVSGLHAPEAVRVDLATGQSV